MIKGWGSLERARMEIKSVEKRYEINEGKENCEEVRIVPKIL